MTDGSRDFSLALGGPLYQLLCRARLSGEALEPLRLRVVSLALIAWLPLFLFSLLDGRAWGDAVRVPFLYDVEQQLRFLVALPLLVISEVVVHRRMIPLIRQFIDRGLVPEPERRRFDAVIESALRWRNSIAAEIVLLALVYGVGVMFLWRSEMALEVSSWYGAPADGRLHPSPAGWWLGLVSLPMFQFLLLRWFYRIGIWAVFLWRVSRIELSLMPTHPDRAGGLGFIGQFAYAFSPLLLAIGTTFAGLIAARIFYQGASITDFKGEILGLVLFAILLVFGPMMAFVGRIGAAKRAGLREYGTLAERYAREFDSKWLRQAQAPREPLLGSADIQSLADMAGAFDTVREMKIVPFGLQNVAHIAVMSLLPVLPLTLTLLSLEEILARILGVVF
jgi:hypothetical protein